MSAIVDIVTERWFLATLTGVGAVGAATFIGLYAARSTGWWRWDTGRNLMVMMGVLFALLAMVSVAHATGPLPRLVWAVGIVALDVAIWRSVVILWRRQRERRDARDARREDGS